MDNRGPLPLESSFVMFRCSIDDVEMWFEKCDAKAECGSSITRYLEDDCVYLAVDSCLLSQAMLKTPLAGGFRRNLWLCSSRQEPSSAMQT